MCCGSYSCFAIRGSDGSAWSWGRNDYGQLGTNNRTSYSSPVSVVGGFSFTKIVCSGSTTLALSNGYCWAWGKNTYGQLGTNNRTSYSSPVSVVGGFKFLDISAGWDWDAGWGFSSSFGITELGVAWSWGGNDFGQLGTNNRTSYSSPVSVVGGFSFTKIS